jgi:NitT/TauT family transport system substrate-binding protein
MGSGRRRVVGRIVGAIGLGLVVAWAGAGPGGAGGAGVGAAAAAAEGPAGVQGLTPVRVGMQYIISDAGLLVAGDLGYMREVGIDFQGQRVDNIELQSGIASGQLDVGGIGVTAATLNAFLRGVRLRIVGDRATLAPNHGYVALVVRRELAQSGQVRSLADLRGRRIAQQPPLHATTSWYLVDRLLARGGLSEADVEFVGLGFADQNVALAGGAIDAAMQTEPSVTAAVESGLAARFAGADEAAGFSLGGLAYSESFAAQTELGRRFMLAYLRAVRTYLDAFTRDIDRARVVEVLTRNTAVQDPALYDRMVMPYINPNGRFSYDGYDGVQEYFIRHGQQPSRVDMTQMVDHAFADWAAGQLGAY